MKPPTLRTIGDHTIRIAFAINVGAILGDLALRQFGAAGTQAIALVLIAMWWAVTGPIDVFLTAKAGEAIAARGMAELAFAQMKQAAEHGGLHVVSDDPIRRPMH